MKTDLTRARHETVRGIAWRRERRGRWIADLGGPARAYLERCGTRWAVTCTARGWTCERMFAGRRRAMRRAARLLRWFGRLP